MTLQFLQRDLGACLFSRLHNGWLNISPRSAGCILPSYYVIVSHGPSIPPRAKTTEADRVRPGVGLFSTYIRLHFPIFKLQPWPTLSPLLSSYPPTNMSSAGSVPVRPSPSLLPLSIAHPFRRKGTSRRMSPCNVKTVLGPLRNSMS